VADVLDALGDVRLKVVVLNPHDLPHCLVLLQNSQYMELFGEFDRPVGRLGGQEKVPGS
jgi:hypothetical protein